MRVLFLSVVLLNGALCAKSQATLDSLRTIWQDGAAADSARLHAIDAYILSGFLHAEPDSAIVLSTLQYQWAERKGLQMEMAKALLNRGRASNRIGAYEQAETDLATSITLFEQLETPSRLAESHMHLGNLRLDLLQYDSATSSFDRSIELYRELNDSAGLAAVLERKSYTAKNSAEYAEAMEYALEALHIWDAQQDDAGRATANVMLSDLLYYQKKYEESIAYAELALGIMTRIGDEAGMADAHLMIGESYLLLEEYGLALEHINTALNIKEALNSPPLSIGSILNSRGNVYKFLNEFDNALADYSRALQICEDLDFEPGRMATTANVGHVYLLMGRYEQALPYTLQAIEMMEASDNKANIIENYLHASSAYEGLGQYADALEWHQKYSATKDSIFTIEKDRTLSELRTKYETETKEEQIEMLEKEAELKEQARQKEKQIRILLIALAALLVLLAVGLWNRLAYTRKSRTLIQQEKDRSDLLLLNILPEEVALELRENGQADAHLIENVTVLFTDFKEFTALSEQLSPQELVSNLNEFFSAFDQIVDKYGIEKIKTIGDSYMAAGGLPTPTTTHATDAIKAALEIRDFTENNKAKKIEAGLPYFEIRIGIHTGPVIAGIVGVKKFQYDIWGDTVNTASRMESSGEVGQVNISETTYRLVKDNPDFRFTSRGKVKARGKGEVEMYFVTNKAG